VIIGIGAGGREAPAVGAADGAGDPRLAAVTAALEDDALAFLSASRACPLRFYASIDLQPREQRRQSGVQAASGGSFQLFGLTAGDLRSNRSERRADYRVIECVDLLAVNEHGRIS
jgi:hypothetical protein